MSLFVLLMFGAAIILMGVAVFLKEIPPLQGIAFIAFFVAVALVNGFHL